MPMNLFRRRRARAIVANPEHLAVLHGFRHPFEPPLPLELRAALNALMGLDARGPTFDQLGYALDFVLRRAADRFTREQAQHAADSAIARVYGSFDGLADDEDRSA